MGSSRSGREAQKIPNDGQTVAFEEDLSFAVSVRSAQTTLAESHRYLSDHHLLPFCCIYMETYAKPISYRQGLPSRPITEINNRVIPCAQPYTQNK